jgi:hypothetical protein
VRPRRSALVVAPVWLALACTGADAGPAAVERDSAGVHIVENPVALADRPLWTVAPEPAVEIGTLEGDEAYQLSGVNGLARLSGGRIVVANNASHEIRFFDAAGTHLRSVGREGEGPGEFRGLGLLRVLPGDTIAVHDWNLSRMSYFDSVGTFVRSFAFDVIGVSPMPIGHFADGGWLAGRSFLFAPGGDGSDIVQDTVPFLVFDRNGGLRDSIGTLLQPEFYVRSQAGNAFAMSLPFGRITETVVVGDRFFAGQNGRFEITRYTVAGTADLVIRLERSPAAITAQDLDRYKAERLADTRPDFRQQAERNLAEMPYPSTFPVFADLAADPDGNLWVLDYPRPGDDRRFWTVFSPEGHALGRVETPPGLQVLDIGRDYVLGVWRDDLDVEHVRLHTLNRVTP